MFFVKVNFYSFRDKFNLGRQPKTSDKTQDNTYLETLCKTNNFGQQMNINGDGKFSEFSWGQVLNKMTFL